MKMIVLILSFCLSISFVCFAQQDYSDYVFEVTDEEVRDANRLVVFSVVEKHAHNYLEGRNFLVSSILGESSKRHLIIIEEDGFFRELFIINDSLVNMTIQEPNEILKLAFDKTIYHTGTKFGFDFPEKRIPSKLSGGNPLYFVFVDKDNNFYGESVTDIYTPLIDRRVSRYLSARIWQDIADFREPRWWHRFRFNFLRRR